MDSVTKPEQIGPEHLAERNDFFERAGRLRQIITEVEAQIVAIEGERMYWRRAIINPRYQMTDDDEIDETGKIVRSSVNGAVPD